MPVPLQYSWMVIISIYDLPYMCFISPVDRGSKRRQVKPLAASLLDALDYDSSDDSDFEVGEEGGSGRSRHRQCGFVNCRYWFIILLFHRDSCKLEPELNMKKIQKTAGNNQTKPTLTDFVIISHNLRCQCFSVHYALCLHCCCVCRPIRHC